MFSDEPYPVAQREVLVGPIRDRGIESSVADAHGAGRCDDPSNVICVPIP
jgi:hypothetical protein